MRKKVIAGNWKMNTERSSAAALAEAVVDGVSGMSADDALEIVLCPPFVLVPIVAEAIAGSTVCLGAQNVYEQPSGAYTGEVSAAMLKSVGCSHVIVGHSERRLMFAESDFHICRKANIAVGTGLSPIICVGETIAEREADRTNEVLRRQVRAALDGIFEFNVRQCVIAYEPIWAIGTGNTATPGQAQEAHRFIRDLISELYTPAVADDVTIIYGGSVNEGNAAGLFALPDVDGGLVGGASLNPAAFLSVIGALD